MVVMKTTETKAIESSRSSRRIMQEEKLSMKVMNRERAIEAEANVEDVVIGELEAVIVEEEVEVVTVEEAVEVAEEVKHLLRTHHQENAKILNHKRKRLKLLKTAKTISGTTETEMKNWHLTSKRSKVLSLMTMSTINRMMNEKLSTYISRKINKTRNKLL